MSEELGLFEAMYNCRAMRRIEAKPVPEELLVKLVDVANQAPSGSNMQRARWIVVRDAGQRRKLAALNKVAVEAYIGPQSGRAGELPHQDAAKRQRMLESVLWQAEHMQDIPALVVPCMEFEGPVSGGEAARAGSSLWPGVQNLLLAARGLGLGAALTTLGLSDRDTAREVLGLPDHVEAYAIIPVGYPMGNFGPVTRLPVEATLHWDRWSK
ncbi:MAG: nitroreductase family protein [Pseudomonadales bacterium]|jgi:nitroreductase|nr:nitroreductase family protein [Pseudomonadales bacterium]MDP6471123.1 nitroreductase family protein [Pseudomonadales bacterium]MDP6825691.1 nitroreductase family protein [Pseudomonadales bacterium]MDP6973147.1 nitroreductase family protein [Pseudomonadales bacterium]